MNRSVAEITVVAGTVASAWGLSEWNLFAGTVAFASAAIFSLVKTAKLIRDGIKNKK